VRVTTADGSALAGSDYTALAPTTLSFAAGEASKPVRVAVAGDTVAEADETFKASLTGAVGAVISDDTGLATIVDDEAATYLSVSDASVSEGNSGSATATFTVTRSGRTTATSSVQVATANGSATAGSDFTARASTTVTFAAGETSKPVSVSVIGDTVPEADETFSLNLTAAVGATISDAAGVATIVNDDAPAYLSVNDIAVNEGNVGTSTATFTVTRTGNTSGAASFTFATANASATAGSDYTARSANTLSYAAGETTKSVVVNVTGDTVDEANETFSLNLTAAVGAVLTDTVGVATIVDDDGPVVPGPATFVSVDDLSVTEGDAGNVGYAFTLTRSGNLAGTSSVNVATADGTAIAGSDYRAIASTTYRFAAGQASRTVQVSVTGDGLDEANETFSLALSAPVGATISDASGVLTVVDNDTTYLSVGDISVTEGNAQTTTATFTLTRTGNTGAASSVAVATANGTATAGGDYTALAATTVTFAAGQASRTVAVSIPGDTVPETDETFSLNLSAPVGARISDAGAIATIVNDDPPGYLSVGDISVTEGNAGPTTATFTVSRTGNTTGAASATVATANGTATAGSDFTALAATTVSFAAGQASKAVTVVITGDTRGEPNETLTLNLSAAVGAVISDAAATATIVNDDSPAYLSVDDVSVTEGNTTTSTVSFTVTRTGDTAGTSSVRVATADATATAGSDYTAVAATTLTFAPGQTTKTVAVTITGDLVVEPNETFTLNLSAPVGATISDTSGLATIVNND
jgi:chitinase